MAQVRQIAQQRGSVQYGLQRFILDTPDDLKKLPAKTVPGSTAYVISTGATYIHNNKNVWVRVKFASSGSNSGSSNPGSGSTTPGTGDIWDGGDIDTDQSYDEIIIWDGGDVDGIEGTTNTEQDNGDGGEI